MYMHLRLGSFGPSHRLEAARARSPNLYRMPRRRSDGRHERMSLWRDLPRLEVVCPPGGMALAARPASLELMHPAEAGLLEQVGQNVQMTLVWALDGADAARYSTSCAIGDP